MGGDEPPIYRKSSCEKLSAVLEKVLHQQPAFFFEDTACCLCLRVQGARCILMEPSLGVAAAIDHSRYLCPS
jgi:hypothetical protein